MARQLIAEGWELYRKVGLPADTPGKELIALRRAFYVGAHQTLLSILRTLSPGKEPTEADLSIVESIDKEATEFAEQVKRGVA